MPLQLHYEDFRAGVPVVVLPGLFGSTSNWRPMARRLAVKYRVLVVDLRNHGRSPHADSMTYEEMAADVLMLLDKQDMARVALLGHSMGGKVAMSFALRYPQRVGALLVADVAPVRYGRHMDDLLSTLLALPIATLRDRNEADAALAQNVEDERLRQFLLQNLVREGEGFGWRVNLKAIGSNMDSIVGFPDFDPTSRYEGPTSFLAGGRSRYVRPEHWDAITTLFPAARLTTLPEAGHWLHAEAPEAFLAAVLACLASARLGLSTRFLVDE
jgi:pimeloyl-ACP methyl ester carboxylesterase